MAMLASLMARSPHLSLQHPIPLNHPAQTHATWRLPWILGATGPDQVGTQWNDLCKALKTFGLAIQCPASDMENVPLESIPWRIARQPIESSFSSAEFQSADVIEVPLFSAKRGVWGWPPELGGVQNFVDWIEAIRLSSGGKTPIALGLPVGVDSQAIELVVAAKVEMMSFHASPLDPDEIVMECLVRARRIMQRADHRGAIWIRTQHSRAEHLVKLIALGATKVTIDGALEELWLDALPEQPSGFLSSVRSSIGKKGECPILGKLKRLNAALLGVLDVSHDSPLAELRHRLRASSDRAARIAGVPHLGDSL